MKHFPFLFLLLLGCIHLKAQEETPKDTIPNIPILTLSESELEADDEFEKNNLDVPKKNYCLIGGAANTLGTIQYQPLHWVVPRLRIQRYVFVVLIRCMP